MGSDGTVRTVGRFILAYVMLYLDSVPALVTAVAVGRYLQGYHTIPDVLLDPTSNVGTVFAVLLGVVVVSNGYSLRHLAEFSVVLLVSFFVPFYALLPRLPSTVTELAILLLVLCLASYGLADWLTYRWLPRRFARRSAG